MKKFIIICLVAVGVLLIGGGVFAYIYLGNNTTTEELSSKPSKRVALDDTAVFYIDLGQMLDKSGIDESFTSANRQLAATVLTANLDDRKWNNYAGTLLANLAHSGIDIYTPIYGYANFNEEAENIDLVFVGKVIDAAKVDEFVAFCSALIEEDGAEPIVIDYDGDRRIIEFGDMVVAYNEQRVVLTYTDSDNERRTFLDKAFKRPVADVSAYAPHDMAIDIRLKPIMNLVRASVEDNMAMLREEMEYAFYDEEREYYAEAIASAEDSLEQFDNMYANLSNDASALLTLTFEDGRIVLEGQIDGYKSDFEFGKKLSNDHLAMVGSDALAILNISVDGKSVGELLSEQLDPKYAAMLNMERNEFNIFAGVLCDAIESIDGDVTLAVTDVNVYETMLSGADILLAADVTDDYIISNIAQYTAGYLQPAGTNIYRADFGLNRLLVGQNDDVFYAALNMEYTPSATPATEAEWFDDVKDSYAYLVLDINNIMDNDFIRNAYRQGLHGANSAEYAIIDSLVNAMGYAYVVVEEKQAAKMVLVFDDKDTNSLEQVVDIVMPHLIKQMSRNLF